MPEDTEPQSGKKHRVIHWNPDAGQEAAKSRWTLGRIAKWTVGGFFGLLLVAAVVIRGAKLVFGPNIFGTHTQAAGAVEKNDPNAAFVSQAKAEAARTAALQTQALLKKTPSNHPSQITQLIEIQKEMNEAQVTIEDNDFSGALQQFQAVNDKMREYIESVKAKDEATKELATISVRLKELEIARTLAPNSMEAATTAASTGSLLIKDGSFLTARKTLDSGLAELKKVDDALADHIGNNLLSGQKSLNGGDKAGATIAFNAVLERSPGNEAAMLGLKRAANIDRVHALLLQGQDLEKLSRFADAAESYKKAFELDTLSAEAQQGQARAARLEKETKFNAAFEIAKAAYAKRDWETVATQTDAALKVYPTRADVQTMQKSGREEAHKDSVRNLLEKGYAFEREYKWDEARRVFESVMGIEKDNADAKEQYIYTGQMIRTLQEFNQKLLKAEELSAAGEFQSAISFFNQAMPLKPAYLSQSERIAKLQAFLKEQSIKVPVTIESDGDTIVSITGTSGTTLSPVKIGKTRTIDILPGNYGIKGQRKGFRDVDIKLEVRNGGSMPITRTVICMVPVSRL